METPSVQELLALSHLKLGPHSTELGKLLQADERFHHSLDLARYSIALAKGFAEISIDDITSLGAAALFHNIGLSQIPLELLKKPRKHYSSQEQSQFAAHGVVTAKILQEFSPSIHSSILSIIREHHESCDEKKEVLILPQLLAVADTLHALVSGFWDGVEHDLPSAILSLDSLLSIHPDIAAGVRECLQTTFLPDIS